MTNVITKHVYSMADFDALPEGMNNITYHLSDFPPHDLELLAVKASNSLVNACKPSPFDPNKATDVQHVSQLISLTEELTLSR